MTQIPVNVNDEQRMITAMNGKFGDEKLKEETKTEFTSRKSKAIMINALKREILIYERDSVQSVNLDIN